MSATEGVNGIGGFDPKDIFKLKEELPKQEETSTQTLGWCNGFNTNQLGGLLNGTYTLGATSSQG